VGNVEEDLGMEPQLIFDMVNDDIGIFISSILGNKDLLRKTVSRE
jgi:hypothetical protein